MALTSEDIELHRRLLRSYRVQEEQAMRRYEAAGADLRRIGFAIRAEETILTALGADA